MPLGDGLADFFLIIGLKRRSTLFPYTTLFRSRAARCCASSRRTATRCRQERAFASTARSAASRLRDRKSTRLNSSHQIISYAVFCLKKKNQDLYAERVAQGFCYRRRRNSNVDG